MVTMKKELISKIRRLVEECNNASCWAAQEYDNGGCSFYRWLGRAETAAAALKVYAEFIPEMELIEKMKKLPKEKGKKPMYYQTYVVKFHKKVN